MQPHCWNSSRHLTPGSPLVSLLLQAKMCWKMQFFEIAPSDGGLICCCVFDMSKLLLTEKCNTNFTTVHGFHVSVTQTNFLKSKKFEIEISNG